MMRLLIIFLIVLFSCSQKSTAPVQQPIPTAQPENKGAVPFVSTTLPENIQVVNDFDIPYFEYHVKIGGTFEKRGNFDILETGILYSQINPNPVLGGSNIFIIRGLPEESTFTTNVNMVAGANLYVRAYAINKHGIGYGNTLNFVLCQRPVGLQSYGLFYAAIDSNGVRNKFLKNKETVYKVASTWFTENTPYVELKGLTAYAPNIAVGSPVFVNNNNSCSTVFDGYYLIDEVPFQIIYIQEGKITEIIEGISDYY